MIIETKKQRNYEPKKKSSLLRDQEPDTRDVTPMMDKFEKEEKDMEDQNFKWKLQHLDKKLKSIQDPEQADYLILLWLRDETDTECENKIHEYEHKFGLLTI